jgi:hypothetical protein
MLKRSGVPGEPSGVFVRKRNLFADPEPVSTWKPEAVVAFAVGIGAGLVLAQFL